VSGFSGEESGEGEFVDGDGVVLEEPGEESLTVFAGAVGAETSGELGADLFEGRREGFAGIEDLDDVPAVFEADGIG
jgi:hypothetical protein